MPRPWFKPIEFVPAGTKFSFVSHYKLALAETAFLAVLTIVLLSTLGLNFGVDFRGGTMIEIRTTDGPADIGAIRTKVGALNLGGLQIQQFGAPNEVLIRIEEQPGGDKAQQEAVGKVQAALGEKIEIRRVEVVGATVSAELITSAITALTLATLGIFAYLWFRFEWQFSVSAIVALLHDMAMVLCLFSVLQLEVDLTIVAALLTLIGYAVNDTVVTFDRVRENLRKYKRMPLGELDRSVGQRNIVAHGDDGGCSADHAGCAVRSRRPRDPRLHIGDAVWGCGQLLHVHVRRRTSPLRHRRQTRLGLRRDTGAQEVIRAPVGLTLRGSILVSAGAGRDQSSSAPIGCQRRLFRTYAKAVSVLSNSYAPMGIFGEIAPCRSRLARKLQCLLPCPVRTPTLSPAQGDTNGGLQLHRARSPALMIMSVTSTDCYADGEGLDDPSVEASRFAHADTIVWQTLRETIDELRAAGVSTLRVLDAGCGPGTWIMRTAAYADRLGLGVEAIGFDIARASTGDRADEGQRALGHVTPMLHLRSSS